MSGFADIASSRASRFALATRKVWCPKKHQMPARGHSRQFDRLWRAYAPLARRTIAWVLGRRDDATCQKRLNKIGLEGKTFVTDDWEGYHRLIPDDQLFTGKDLTVPIEQDNSNIRHFLARFRRRTKVVSKVVEMVDLSLRIYHHFHDNLDAFAEKAAVFRAIFS